MVDARESQILERPGPKGIGQPVAGGRRIDLATRHLLEQILKLFV